MDNVQRAILPGVFVGILIVIIWAGQAVYQTDSTISAVLATPTPSKVARVMGQLSDKEEDAQLDNSCSISKKYPVSIRNWCGLIEKYARQNKISPDLVAAVMLQESGGNPKAYSKSGAVGLMQVMPRDGLAASFMCSGKPCFSNRPSMAELYDPEFNISYGTRMLSGLIQRHGTVRDALKAYGPINYGYIYADKVIAIMNNYR